MQAEGDANAGLERSNSPLRRGSRSATSPPKSLTGPCDFLGVVRWGLAGSRQSPRRPYVRVPSAHVPTVDNVSKAPHLFACLEDEEWRFVDETRQRRPYDALLVRAHFVTPYPDERQRFGQPHDRLLRSIEEAGARWAFDLAVEDLGHPKSSVDNLRGRQAASPLVRALAPPIEPERLLDPGWQAFVADVAAEQQTKAGLMTSVGFEFASLEDPRWLATRAFAELALQRASSRDVLTPLRVTTSRTAVAAAAAEILAQLGVQRVLLQVRCMTPETASATEVERYCHLVAACRRAGLYAVAHRVGRLGPVLAIAGVRAFSTGTRYYRTIPKANVPSANGGGGGGTPLTYEVPGELRAVPRWAARDPTLPPCFDPACDAAKTDDGIALREHLLHELRRQGARAAADPRRFLKQMRRLENSLAPRWAEGAERYLRDARAA